MDSSHSGEGRRLRRHRGAVLLRIVLGVATGAGLFVAAGTAASASTHHHNKANAHRAHKKTAKKPSGVLSGGIAYHPVTNYLKYVGGHQGAANKKLSTIEIGVINQQGGSADLAPQWTTGNQLAARYLNKDLGGIDGHPVKLVTCFIADTVSDATRCGQQFANDKQISAISVGPVSIGNEALENALRPKHKVLVWGISGSPVDETYPYGFSLFGDAFHIESQFATFIKNYKPFHAKTVALIYNNFPGASLGVDIAADAMRYVGLKVNVVGYDPSQTDLTTPLEAAHASTADVVFGDVNGGTACADLYHAVKQLSIKTPIVVNVPCASKQDQEADGGELPAGWYYGTAIPFYYDHTDPSGAAFLKVTKKFGLTKWAPDAWVENGFGGLLTVAKWDGELLKAHKSLTPHNILKIGRAQHAPTPFSAPRLVCGSFPKAPIVCNDRDSFYLNPHPGLFKRVATWILPPKGFKNPSNLE